MSEYSPFMSEAERRRRRRDQQQAQALQQLGLVGAVAGPAVGTLAGAGVGGLVGLAGGPGGVATGIGTGAGIGGTVGTVGGQLGNMFLGNQASALTDKWDELDARRLARAKFIQENFAPFTGR